MPLSSLIPWLKYIRHGKDPDIVLENTSSKLSTHTIVSVQQEIDDKFSIISTASAKMNSIATRGVLSAIKAQQETSMTSNMAIRIASVFSEITKKAIVLAAFDERRARAQVQSTARSTQTGLPVALDLTPIATSFSRWARRRDAQIQGYIGKINRNEGKFAQDNPQKKEAVLIGLTSLVEATSTIAKIVEDHVAVIAQSKQPVLSIEELLFGIHMATTQAAFAAAETVTFEDCKGPPAYEENASQEVCGLFYDRIGVERSPIFSPWGLWVC